MTPESPPNDIDLKVIIDGEKPLKMFVEAVEEYQRLLQEAAADQIQHDRHPLITSVSRIQGRFAYYATETGQYPQTHAYGAAIQIQFARGKTIDLILQNPRYLPGNLHIEAERKLKNPFAILYHDSAKNKEQSKG